MSFVGVGQIVCVCVCVCVCPSFPFGIEGGVWDVIVLIPEHCLSINFLLFRIFSVAISVSPNVCFI